MEIVSKILKSETVICIKYTNSAPDDDEAPANLVGGFDSEYSLAHRPIAVILLD